MMDAILVTNSGDGYATPQQVVMIRPVIRRLDVSDIPWALDLAEKAYKRNLGREAWAGWIIKQLQNPNILIARGNHSIVVCACQPMLPDLAEKEGLFPYWFSETNGHAGELVSLFEFCERWLRDMGASHFTLRPTNGTDATPLAFALGANESFPSFRKDLT